MNNFDNKVEQGALLTMDNIMDASFGEVANELTVNFKKTVLVRSYETEVIEATTTVKLDEPLKGIERMFVQALLQVQMEYTVYISLVAKGLVTVTDFNERKQCLEQEVNIIKAKADQLLGIGVIDRYIQYIKLDK